MAEKKRVNIFIHTEIDDNGEKETITERHTGTFFNKDATTVLSYTDEKNELGNIKNIITLHPNKLSVKRSGAVSMQQIFMENQQTECMYQHPYGRFLMEIKTKQLAINVHEKAVVVYDMLFQGSIRHYKLSIEFTEVP